MSERYSKIFSLRENLYAEGSPVVIKAGALLKDNEENRLIAQLKLQNISKKSITRVKVELTAHNSSGNPIADSIIHEYSDLTVTQGTDFGTQTPIIISNPTVTYYTPCIKEVTFTDGTLWNDNGSSLESTQKQTVPSKKKKNLKLSILVPVLAVLIAVLGYFVGYPMIARLTGNHMVYIKMYNAKTYTIPATVEKIPAETFKDCDILKSVTIPGNVKSIGRSAFLLCENLESVIIENGVTSIEDRAFMYCDSLTSITIPDSVTHIGSLAFQGCDNLTSVVISKGVTSIDSNTFSYCKNLTDITIPNGVTDIGLGAFSNCSNLKNITIPNSVKHIGQSAFWGCSSLKSITIPEGVTKIDAYAFRECESLESIVIPNTVTSIGSSAFEYCDELKTIYFTGSEADWYYMDKCYINSHIKIHYNYIPQD